MFAGNMRWRYIFGMYAGRVNSSVQITGHRCIFLCILTVVVSTYSYVRMISLTDFCARVAAIRDGEDRMLGSSVRRIDRSPDR